MKCFSYPGGDALSDTQRSRASGGSDIVFEAAAELKCQLELDGLATPPGGITIEARARFFRMTALQICRYVPLISVESAKARRTAKRKSIRFKNRLAPAAPSARVFLGWEFSSRGPSARYSVFWCKFVAFILRVPSRPLLHFWAEHAFFAFFRSWGLAIL